MVVLERLVRVRVGVSFGDEEHRAEQHDGRSRSHEQGGTLAEHRDRRQGPQEGCGREERSFTRGSK
jgi:hypothetical protein